MSLFACGGGTREGEATSPLRMAGARGAQVGRAGRARGSGARGTGAQGRARRSGAQVGRAGRARAGGREVGVAPRYG